MEFYRNIFANVYSPDLCNELSNCSRKTGEPLILANDIKSLTRRPYAHMPLGVQGELARALPRAACSGAVARKHRFRCSNPQTLMAALKLAVERVNVWGMAGEAP